MFTPPPSKLPDVGTTIFAVMSARAAEAGAINLAQGFPDFPPPPGLTHAMDEAMRDGRNQYAPLHGLPALREAVAERLATAQGVRPDPDREITVTSGATEALFDAIQAVVRPGDEVVVLTPAYDAYGPAVTLAGGRVVPVSLRRDDFRPDIDALREAISPRTRLVILNSPHNPTGAVWPRTDLEAIAALLADGDTMVLSDEVYEHIAFTDEGHVSALGVPGLAERAFVVSSFGKTYHCTGWKVGYCIAPPALTTEFRKVHQFVTFATHTPSQAAFAAYMQAAPHHADELAAFYRDKRDRLLGWLADSRLATTPGSGTYFQLVDYSAVSNEPDTDFCERLIRDAGVAAIPLSPFYADPPSDLRQVRLCFAKQDATLDMAGERLCRL
ncbi:methionine aminotransferase [Arhodomonas aquaeolei]|uniref:methionine aminotransferase n=1 Tax=Arhodomonas aquaeolei TaxID=2369 RepID=UPI000373FEEB|nr:methionine aminotransferase [Arhodomonas aquaeolei]